MSDVLETNPADSFLLGACLALIYCIVMFSPGCDKPTISYSKVLLAKPEIKLRNSSLIVCGYHIHHWIMFSVATVMMWMCKVKNLVLYGFAAIMTAQGLTYSDRFTLRRNDD